MMHCILSVVHLDIFLIIPSNAHAYSFSLSSVLQRLCPIPHIFFFLGLFIHFCGACPSKATPERVHGKEKFLRVCTPGNACHLPTHLNEGSEIIFVQNFECTALLEVVLL